MPHGPPHKTTAPEPILSLPVAVYVYLWPTGVPIYEALPMQLPSLAAHGPLALPQNLIWQLLPGQISKANQQGHCSPSSLPGEPPYIFSTNGAVQCSIVQPQSLATPAADEGQPRPEEKGTLAPQSPGTRPQPPGPTPQLQDRPQCVSGVSSHICTTTSPSDSRQQPPGSWHQSDAP